MTSDTPISAQALLTNAVGLHARPAVKLTQLAKRFAAAVDFALEPQGPWTNAKSPVQVMRVKAAKGSILYFRAHGADAADAVAALVGLVQRRFDEDEKGGGEDLARDRETL